MASLRLLSSLALASTLKAVLPAFEAGQGCRVETVLLPTALLLPRIRGGERADVAILTAAGIQALVDEGVLHTASRLDLAISSVGIAVRSGAPRPPLGTEAELVAALLGARSVGLSRAGASGLYFEALLARLGIADTVHAKAVIIESGYTAELAANGQVELAVQQVSELLMVPGVDLVGPLPAGLGAETVFTGAVFADAAAPATGAALLRAVVADPAVLRNAGLAPARPLL